MSFLPYICLLVNSVDRVSDFITEVFGCTDDQADVVDNPVVHRIIQLSKGSSIVIAQKESCNEIALATFSLLAVKHALIAVDDIERVRSAATKLGAQVTRNDNTEKITICFCDGPEEIFLHVMDSEKIKRSSNELIMTAILSDSNSQEVAQIGAEIAANFFTYHVISVLHLLHNYHLHD